MATRSLIGIETSKGVYDFVYCHNDGNLEFNGAILVNHYKDVEVIQALIYSGGNMSSLSKDVEKCKFYSGKDEQYITLTEEELDSRETQWRVDFVYAYGFDNKWRYRKVGVEEIEEHEMYVDEIKGYMSYYVWSDTNEIAYDFDPASDDIYREYTTDWKEVPDFLEDPYNLYPSLQNE